MLGLFQAKSRDLHMTPVCLEVIITKTQGTHKAYKELPQGKRLWISARMLRVMMNTGLRKDHIVQRAASARSTWDKTQQHTHVNCANSVAAYVRGVYTGKTAYSTHQNASRNPFSCALRGKTTIRILLYLRF